MDTKKVRALLLALERGSLTAVGSELGYTQSGMTHMMHSLEDEIGLTLLVRSKTGVRLSAQGQELFEYLRRLDTSAQELEAAAKELKQHGVSTLRLGAYSSMARQWLPAILSHMRRSCPEIEVSVTMFSGIDETYAAVKEGRLDCAMCSRTRTTNNSMSWVHLRDDPLVAVLPANTDFEGNSYPVQNFDGQEFLMPSGGFELDILPALSAGGVKCHPRIRYTNLDDASLASMVAHGLGVTVLSDLVMQSISDRVIALPIAPSAFRSLGIIYNSQRKNDKNILRLVDCAKKTISAMYAEN